ncbi:MAG: hypothetical protein ACP5MH_00475 [Thermoproteus sp.]
MDIIERYRREVEVARTIVAGRRFRVVVHNGTAHADDTIAAALLYRAGAEEVYRLGQADELLEIARGGMPVVYADIGYRHYDQLKSAGVVAVLDHHAPNGEPEYVELPSSLMQTVEALGMRPRPRVSMLFTAADLVDRFGAIAAKKWLGIYGASLNQGLSAYFGMTSRGKYDDVKFLELVAEAAVADFDVEDFSDYSKAYSIAQSIDVDAERFPRTLAQLRLMRQAANDVVSTSLSQEAQKVGFGVDFAAHAVLAVPQLAEYVAKGLAKYFDDSIRAIRTVEGRRYAVVEGGIRAVAVDDSVPPTALWNALLDLSLLREDEPVIVVVKDVRNPGAYSLWRPDRHKDRIDFRKLSGDAVIFKHQSGFMAVVKAENAEEAARYALKQLGV